MRTLHQQYKDTKKLLEELRSDILETSPVVKGSLIKDDKSGKHYRVGFVSVDDNGDLSISTTEIRNYSVNWQSCNIPRYKSSTGLTFEVIHDWKFNQEEVNELYDKLEDTDSISEREDLISTIQEKYTKCFHEWDKQLLEENYTCKHCGCTTHTTHDGSNTYEDINLEIEV